MFRPGSDLFCSLVVTAAFYIRSSASATSFLLLRSARAIFMYACVLLLAMLLFSFIVGVIGVYPLVIRGAKGGTDGPMEFKIGLLTPWNGTFEDFSGLTSASAISIAIEKVHADPEFRDKLRFRYS